MFRNFCLFIFLCFFVSLSFASSPSNILDKKLSKFHNMTADFHQIIKDSTGVVLQESFGNMAIERPYKFKWNVERDIKQLIVTNGNKIWIYDPDLNQVVIREFDESVYDSAIMILANPEIQNDFSVGLLDSDHDVQRFKLIPIKKESSFDSIIVEFNKDRIVNMKLMNNLNQVTELHFSNVSLNSFLNEKLFSFVVPKDVDVVFE